jgi:hypothetical protein
MRPREQLKNIRTGVAANKHMGKRAVSSHWPKGAASNNKAKRAANNIIVRE